MRLLSLKGYLAQRRAIKLLVKGTPLPPGEEKQIAYVCAHYTMMGLSFVIKMNDGTILQKKVYPTPKAVAEMFAAIEG